MKKYFKSIAIIAAAAMTLAGCQKEASVEKRGENGLYKYSFSVVGGESKVDAETKAVIESDHVAWVSGDQVGIFIGETPSVAEMDVTSTPVKAILYSTSTIPAGTMAYGYFPYTEDNDANTPDKAKISFASRQYGAGLSAMPMAAIPFEVKTDIDPEATSGNGSLKFMNLGSVVVFKVWSSDASQQQETVQSISFETETAISGDAFIDLTAVSDEDLSTLALSVSEDGSEKYVKVAQTAPVAASKADATEIKMVVMPGTYTGTLRIVTDANTYSFALTDKTFNRSGVRTMGVNLANAASTEDFVEMGEGYNLKWARRNVGADTPWEYGDYYAWGETEVYYSSLDPLTWKEGKENGYNWSSYSLCDNSMNKLTKYNTNSKYGSVDNKSELEPEDDAARANWGEPWRMPTENEWKALMDTDNFTWTWKTNYNGKGINGFLVTSNVSGYEGNTIFLPASSYMALTLSPATLNIGSYFNYWSSTLNDQQPTNTNEIGATYKASYLSGALNGQVYCLPMERWWGMSIRPVYSPSAEK